MPRLLYRDSQGREGAIALDEGAACDIGRALECGVRTDDALVSRRHSRVQLEAGQVVIEDLGSANGTYVNDVRASKQVLRHNDVVRCGSLWLRYLEDGATGEVPAPLPLELRETVEESGVTGALRPPRVAHGTASPDAPSGVALPPRAAAGGTRAGFDDERERIIQELRGEVGELRGEIADLRRTLATRDEAARGNLKVIAELRRQMARRRDGTDTREEGTVTRVHPVEPELLGAARRPAEDDAVERERTDVVAAIGLSPASAPTVDR